ncbi:UPF0426 protein At1g28150, chloroplastic-like [Macadamia integrifolia]|uniref:UPF0426 protein At1g28150, chloroplastic-like n=1 Tax=Macadamia integrifolia TaxID=60698 RepID=UPI001C4F9760|nr:UPF0426 protein At1g28150, chloroplastic-like [Macadamia integrifolia]
MMMALFLVSSSSMAAIRKSNPANASPSPKRARFGGFRVKAFFNPIEEPILEKALKEPAAFMGGMLAGLLRIDLNEDPLKEWITRTVEASGITEEEIYVKGSKLEEEEEEEAPQQIEIE